MAFDKVKYDNQYAKNNYDRIPINVPKGKKAEIEAHSKKKGFKSVNAYVVDLIDKDMKDEVVGFIDFIDHETSEKVSIKIAKK